MMRFFKDPVVLEVSLVFVIAGLGIFFWMSFDFYDSAALRVHENAHKWYSETFRGQTCSIEYLDSSESRVSAVTVCDGQDRIGAALEGVFAELLVGLLIMACPLSAFAVTWFLMLAYKLVFISNTDFMGVPYAFNVVFGLFLLGLAYLSMELQRLWALKGWKLARKHGVGVSSCP